MFETTKQLFSLNIIGSHNGMNNVFISNVDQKLGPRLIETHFRHSMSISLG